MHVLIITLTLKDLECRAWRPGLVLLTDRASWTYGGIYLFRGVVIGG